jgi:transposase
MPRIKDTKGLSVMHEVCCGLDVHKESISACLFFPDERGSQESENRGFTTFTDDLARLRDWLVAHGCPVVAIESTGICWRPVHNVLEGYIQVVLVNARHVKNLPGRKIDVSDSQWLAGLLRVGLLRGVSFLPKRCANGAI